MPISPFDRRRFLSRLAAGAGGVWLSTLPSMLQAAGREAALALPGEPYRVLTREEADVLEAIACQFIPTDETPGAREAHVVRFLDLSLATFASDQLSLYRDGLARLNREVRRRNPAAASFAGLAADAQVALLRDLEASRSPFFESLLTATLTGMFANPEYGGNFEKAGWKLIGFEDRFAWAPPFGDYDRE